MNDLVKAAPMPNLLFIMIISLAFSFLALAVSLAMRPGCLKWYSPVNPGFWF